MRTLHNRVRRLMLAGALLGALAAFFVGGLSQVRTYLEARSFNCISTGATQGTDQLTYFTMCRAVLRSTSGIAYTYPYELYWPVPEIAFQLPITLLAWLGWFIGLPAAFEAARILGAAAAGAALGGLGAMFPRGFWRKWFYFFCIVGGGLYGLSAIAHAYEIAGMPGVITEPYQYLRNAMDRMLWWLPFLVHNLRMPLECIYHGLVMGGLFCLVYNRLTWASICGGLLWISNPFSAVAFYAAAIPWLTWRVCESKGTARRRFAICLATLLAIFATAALYYAWYLNRWELYRELNHLYKIQVVPPLTLAALAKLILPFSAALPLTIIIPVLRRKIWGHPTWRLFALLAVAHIALLQQGLLLGDKAMQAYHYNRGYLQLGLVMVCWRVIQVSTWQFKTAEWRKMFPPSWSFKSLATRRLRKAMLAVFILLGVSCLDLVYFIQFSLTQPPSGFISRGLWNVLRAIPEEPAPVIVHCELLSTPGSLVGALTPHIAYDSPETMIVPFPQMRLTLYEEALTGMHGGIAGLGISYLITSTDSESTPTIAAQGWNVTAESYHMLLYRSPVISPGTRQKRPPGGL